MSFFENSKPSMNKKHTQLNACTDNYNIIGQHHSKYIKQGYALKNWEEGLSEEAVTPATLIQNKTVSF